MITADMKQAIELQHKLRRLNRGGIAFAARQTVNDLAFAGRAEAVKIVDQTFTNRNAWTKRTINVDRARDVSVDATASLGSTQEYMARQEYGGQNRAPIPTPAAAGEEGARVRRRVVRRQNRTPNLNASRIARGAPMVARVRAAIAAKERVILVERGEGIAPGIYRIKGGTPRRPERAQLVMVRATEARTRTAPTRWLSRASAAVGPRAGNFYARALQFQLNRLKGR